MRRGWFRRRPAPGGAPFHVRHHLGPRPLRRVDATGPGPTASDRGDGPTTVAGHDVVLGVATEGEDVPRDADRAEEPAPHAPGQVPGIPPVALPEPALPNARSDDSIATVVCVANQKGGVGKTTTTVSLAAALAELGVRVLIVDLDPQGNATTGLGLRAEEGEPSTYHVLVDQQPIAEVARRTDVEHLDVLPSSLDLAGAEVELVPAFSRELRLRRALEAVRRDYDVVFIDCPPSLGMLTVNALAAADEVLVPIQCEYYALEGLGQLLRTVRLVGDDLNRALELGGVVLTMFDGRTNLSQQVVDEVRDYFGEKAYATVIPRTVRLSEAPSFGQPITVFDPTSRGARAYQRLAHEVAERLGLPTDDRDDDRSPLDRLLGAAPTRAAAGDADETRDERGTAPTPVAPASDPVAPPARAASDDQEGRL